MLLNVILISKLENDESICSSLYCTNSNGICVAISGKNKN